MPPQLSVLFALMRLACSAEFQLPGASAVHRHAHYSFLLYESGTATALVDLQTLTFGAGDLYYILPGQVHQRLREHQLQGWFLGVDSGLIPPEFRYVLEGSLALQQPLPLPAAQLYQCRQLLAVLHERVAASTFPWSRW